MKKPHGRYIACLGAKVNPRKKWPERPAPGESCRSVLAPGEGCRSVPLRDCAAGRTRRASGVVRASSLRLLSSLCGAGFQPASSRPGGAGRLCPRWRLRRQRARRLEARTTEPSDDSDSYTVRPWRWL